MQRPGFVRMCCCALLGSAVGLDTPAMAVPPSHVVSAAGEQPAVVSWPQIVETRTVRGNATSNQAGYPALNVTLLSQVTADQFGGGASSANDIWGYVSPSGREYAIVGLDVGTGFVDLRDPTDPLIVANIPDAGSGWSDMKTYQQYCYNVNENSSGGGMQVIDLTQIDAGIVTYVQTVSAGFGRAHNVALNPDSGRVYPCGTNTVQARGFAVFDLADPANPVPVGGWGDSYAHDLQVVSYDACPLPGEPQYPQAGQSCEIAFAFGAGNGLYILDVTDPANIITLSGPFEYPTLAYCHQGWLSEDRSYLFMDDESDETSFGLTSTTYVIDVTDLSSPFLERTFTNGITSIDHNLFTRGRYIFAANYRSGLRIFDAGDINNMQEIGYFDTFPSGNGNGFSGAWGNYPYLPSGIVLVSDMQRGLFVLDPFDAVGCQQDSHCSDGNPCTQDLCDGNGGCANSLVGAGAPCDDGDVCSINGTCSVSGVCESTDVNTIPCSDDGPCAPGACDVDAGFCVCAACTQALPPSSAPGSTTSNRFLSILPDNAGLLTALRVVAASLPSPYSSLNGADFWVGEPNDVSLLPSLVDDTPPTVTVAPLACEPVYADWGSLGEVHVYGDAIIPGADYSVQAISAVCLQSGVMSFSVSQVMGTSRHGDITGSCAVAPCSPPDGAVDVTIDLLAALDSFRSAPSAPNKIRCDMEPAVPDLIINITDAVEVIDAFRGLAYAQGPPTPCP